MPTDQANDYRFGYSRDEMDRLGNQHRVWAEDNRRLLARAGFGAGATLVDLGCGPGYTTLDLARVVGPDGRVIAVDRDGQRSLPLLEERAAAAGLANIETRTSELEAFELPEGSVDGVYGRWVLMYLPERAAEALTARAARWLRPGGACALAEFCNYRHIHIHPPSAHLPAVAEALMRAVAGDRGCNPEIGNALPGLLHRAGLEVELHVVTKAVRATTPQWHWPDALFRDHLPGLVDEGYLTREVLDAFFTEWEERSREPDAVFFGSPMMEAVGRLG
ncbi:MAG: methyltransferase domain-containing protein [bacterium]|nr:methyltransferase domain-containing protein [bacterium]